MPEPRKMPAKKAPAKKAAARKRAQTPIEDEQEVTGPSSDPVQPVATLQSATAVAGVRVGAYSFSSAFIMQGLDAFGITDSLATTQHDWVFGAITIGLAFATNFVEAVKGRRLLGTAS